MKITTPFHTKKDSYWFGYEINFCLDFPDRKYIDLLSPLNTYSLVERRANFVNTYEHLSLDQENPIKPIDDRSNIDSAVEEHTAFMNFYEDMDLALECFISQLERWEQIHDIVLNVAINGVVKVDLKSPFYIDEYMTLYSLNESQKDLVKKSRKNIINWSPR